MSNRTHGREPQTKRAVNVSEKLRHKNDSVDRMIRRFLRKSKKQDIVRKYRARGEFEKPSVKRRMAGKRRQKVLDKQQQRYEQMRDGGVGTDDKLPKPKAKRRRR